MRRAINYILYFVLTILLTTVCGVFMEGVPGTTVWWEQLYRLPENSLKVVFLGNSHCYHSFIPEVFEAKLELADGGGAIQLGSSGVDVVPIEFYVKEIFRKQNPDLVVIEAYSFIDRGQWVDEEKIANNRDQAMKSMRWGTSRIEGNLAMFGTRAALRKMIPFWDNHSNWENLDYVQKRLDFFLKPETILNAERYSKSAPDMSKETAMAFKEMKDIPHKWKMDADQRESFQRIAELCKEKQARLIIVMTPLYKEWRRHVDYEGRHNEIQKLADECGVLFIDYNESELYDDLGIDEAWFLDERYFDTGNTHLSVHGAKTLSCHLADWIQRERDNSN